MPDDEEQARTATRNRIAAEFEILRRQYEHRRNPFLFPGSGNESRSPQGLATWLAKTVAREIGIEFNMHLARHFAAWNFLRMNPGQYEIVRQVLGNNDIETTMAYYVGMEREAAARHFDATILRDRQATRKIAARAFRKGRGGLGPRSGGR